MTYYLFFLVSGLAFASFASFLMVVGSRTVKQQSFVHGRSKCDHCQQQIPAIHLFPIIGYILTKGKCHFCHQHIPAIYPLSEGYFALICLWMIFAIPSPNQFFYLAYFAILLMMMAADLQAQWIPDRFQLLLFIAVIIDIANLPLSFMMSHLIFASFIGCILITMNYIVKQGIGGGDIKTISILALAFGPLPLTWLVLTSSGLALLHIAYLRFVMNKEPRGLPFLPYLFFSFPIILFVL